MICANKACFGFALLCRECFSDAHKHHKKRNHQVFRVMYFGKAKQEEKEKQLLATIEKYLADFCLEIDKSLKQRLEVKVDKSSENIDIDKFISAVFDIFSEINKTRNQSQKETFRRYLYMFLDKREQYFNPDNKKQLNFRSMLEYFTIIQYTQRQQKEEEQAKLTVVNDSVVNNSAVNDSAINNSAVNNSTVKQSKR